ncbi:Long-chain-fatty-acid--CoA ligase 6 [Phytophthora citrophthora]|uniref:Long-chain-fatty-acid--CoA ligase 6 n=1 Tax=Phytophthora citrophthora TaxID=4793 RepID=A0AAD9G059_9STRA|nr:Long-chain-fatty-acid--CoA ligase 6 [Phytophthora citrophthora]
MAVIDRKENIYKLSQGEYVSPERVEGVYGQSPFVGQVFVHDDSFKNYVVGIVVPDPEFVAAWAEKQGLRGEEASLEKLCAPGNWTLVSVIQEDLRQLALAAKLLPFGRAHKLRQSSLRRRMGWLRPHSSPSASNSSSISATPSTK